MNIFDKHRLKIARSTLKMSDLGSSCAGGMTKEEARKVIDKHKNKTRQLKKLAR